MGGSPLSTKLLAQFLDPYSLSKNLFIYDNPSPVIIKNALLDLNIDKNSIQHQERNVLLVNFRNSNFSREFCVKYKSFNKADF